MTTNPINQMSGEAGLPLQRPYRGRLVAGVAAGIAEYLDVDVAIVRVGIVVLSVLGGVGIPAYIAAWLLIPNEGASESVAEELVHHFQEHHQHDEYHQQRAA